MKKILCFTLALLLVMSNVFTAYASSSDGDHGGVGGTVGWDSLAPISESQTYEAKTIVGEILIPIKKNMVGMASDLINFFNFSDLDNDSKKYIDDNIADNVRTDGKYYYFNPTFINNVNQKIQDRVHALNGYYLIDSIGSVNYDNLTSLGKKIHNLEYDNYTGSDYADLTWWTSLNHSIFVTSFTTPFVITLDDKYLGDNFYLYLDSNGNVGLYDSINDKIVNERFLDYSDCYLKARRWYEYRYLTSNVLNKVIGVLGAPVKIFYSIRDIRNYVGQGQQHYSPHLPNKTIKIPINYINVAPKLNLDFDTSSKSADEIQGQLNLNFNAWLDKLAEINVNSGGGSSGGGSSGGGSGGDHGGTGGDFLTPTPTPSPDDGFTSDTVNLLEEIYNWLVSFGEKHDIFAKKITDYIEANDGKLDQIIEAINALANGKTESENNGCKYDFSALSDFMSKLWNESDKKFDNMISLLEENNRYQQKLVDSLNEIKAILVTQTILELFQDRSTETANKAKDKFPTSLPWDIAMVVNAMAAEPQEIKLTIPVKISSLHIDEELVIDLTGEEWEKLAKTCRYLLSVLFILFMVHLSRKMFFSGGDD